MAPALCRAPTRSAHLTRRVAQIGLTAAALVACASTPDLRPGADRVQIGKADPDPNQYSAIGPVEIRQITNQRDIFLNGWRGLELELLNPDGSITKARIFATKEQIYEVWVHVPKIRSKSEDIQNLLDSFKLTEQGTIELD